MKRMITYLLGFAFASNLFAEVSQPISNLNLTGTIDGENVTFALSFTAEVDARSGADIRLVEGDVALLKGDFPSGAKLSKQDKSYFLHLPSRGKHKVVFNFASLPVKDGDWRQTSFKIPDSIVRKLTMVSDRDDLEVNFPGAMRVEHAPGIVNGATVTAYQGTADVFTVRWKPEVKRLDGDLVVSCDANSIASAGVGALRLNTLYTYRVVQGALKYLTFALPEKINVTQVKGADIRKWQLSPDGLLEVELNRPYEDDYQLEIESDRALAAFPTDFDMPLIRPLNVIRTSGFLQVGTDGAIKLVVRKSSGLTQIDQAAFPALVPERRQPRKTAFAYQYANMPFNLELAADDIITAFSVDERMVLHVKDQDLVLDAALELDVRDAPAREVLLETSRDWIVSNVAGANLADYDVRDVGDVRQVYIFFRDGVIGRTLVNIRLERSLKAEQRFSLPRMHLENAKTERGFIVLSADTGLRLVTRDLQGLREVHPGSLPIKVPQAHQAYRFKSADWTLDLDLESRKSSIYSEIFHLFSLGDGVMYGSSAVTYHVTGSPVKEFKLNIPSDYQNVEFIGRDMRTWKQEGNIWTVSLQEKAIGDYTLLVTYDRQFADEGDALPVSGIETVGTESEVGYIALSGAAKLAVTGTPELDASLIPIERLEIPSSYHSLINAPVLMAYKYVSKPHQATVAIARLPTQPILSQVADHTVLSTRMSEAGEAVTTASYFVKNTSSQYLGITLPAKAKLWSARVDGDEVQVLNSDETTGTVLIPLSRHQDPNLPSVVQVTYAEGGTPLKDTGMISLTAPSSAAQSVFARWQLHLPEGYTATQYDGNMASADALQKLGVGGFFRMLRTSGEHILQLGGSWLALTFGCLLAASLALFSIGRRRWVIPSLLLGPAVLILVLAFAPVHFANGNQLRPVLEPLKEIVAPIQQTTFTKVVNLAQSGLVVSLDVAPSWLGSGGSLLILLLAGVTGILLIGWGCFGGFAARLSLAVGLTLLISGLTYSAVTIPIALGLVLIGLPGIMLVRSLLAAFQAGKWLAAKAPAEPAPPRPVPVMTVDPASGFVRLPVLMILTGLFLMMSVLSAKEIPQPKTAPAVSTPGIVMDYVDLVIDAPKTGRLEEKVAIGKGTYTFDVKEEGCVQLLKSPAVLTSYALKSKYLAISRTEAGYDLHIEKAGSYTVEIDFLMPVQIAETSGSLSVFLPDTIRNHVVLNLPEPDWEIASADTVLLTTESKGAGLSARAVFKPVNEVELTWKPQTRLKHKEEAIFYSEMHSLGVFESGVVNLDHQIKYQIAQGELQQLEFIIPDGMSVTAVRGADLNTWRYDPETHLLEAVLNKPVSGDYQLSVVTQIPVEGIPYEVLLPLPAVKGAGRQRGSIAIAAGEAVMVRVDTLNGLHSMNIGDFPAAMVTACKKGHRPFEIKRALKYHQLPASVNVYVEKVLPELRVAEQSHLDVSEERVVLSSRLTLTVDKAGIFSTWLGLPDGYDVESLTGEEVSHWDEHKTSTNAVTVHFHQQVMGERTISLVLTRTEKGVGTEIVVPRIHLQHAIKHHGTVTISAERGIRLSTAEKDGVSELNPRELGIELPGYLAYKLLRPSWRLRLSAEVLDASLRAQTVQRVAVSEGILQGKCFIHYKIEGAGAKAFKLLSPQPGAVLSIFGADIAQSTETDTELGVWTVTLRNKIQNEFRLEVHYQLPFELQARTVTVQPVIALDDEGQKGYLAILSSDRLQVTLDKVPVSLREENARNIPAEIGAGDLSDAILCYRITRNDFLLDLNVLRHKTASVLPAVVKRVDIESVVSEDDQMVSRVGIDLQIGDLRFLPARLPKGSQMWSVQVNGKPSTPLIQGEDLLIPLDSGTEESHVEIIYGGIYQPRTGKHIRQVEGPRFGLPLSAITWHLFLPERYRYHHFDGSLQYREPEGDIPVFAYDTRAYTEEARRNYRQTLEKAQEVMELGAKYARTGQHTEAKQAFEAAMYFSQGQDDFNEDARIQYRNLAREQAVAGLVDRRGELKKRTYGKADDHTISTKDNLALNQVAEKMIDQQAAASQLVSTIHVTLPVSGKRLDFYRELQIEPFAPMEVSYEVSEASVGEAGRSIGAGVGLFLVILLLVGVRRRA